MTPLDFFAAAHEALSRILMQRDEPEMLIDRLVTQAYELFEQNIAIHTPALPQLDCRKNCPSCCSLRVTATAPEIFLLARYVRLVAASQRAAPLQLLRRVAEAEQATRDLDESQRMALRWPCPLMFKGVCIVHAARPLACRGHASFDRAACARAAAGRDVEVPISELHMNMRGLVQNALQSALRTAGLPWGLYELNHGLALALGGQEIVTAWTKGEDSHAPTIAELDMAALAGSFDTILGRH